MRKQIIRKALLKDVDALARIENLCFSSPWSKEAFAQDIEKNALARYFLVEEDEIIIAYAGLWLIHPEGHITNIAVHPQYRRKGIGRALLKNMLEQSEEEGITCHTLEVRISNLKAIELYRSFGFFECGIRKNYYEDTGEDALILWRESTE
ncbi:MAG: ribosomal-protein-alanine N-acetyltransferase [Clostridia bacterium]|nr:ribosomal-protein-alanine N-acetyltransferase [Clostridia bacterium]